MKNKAGYYTLGAKSAPPRIQPLNNDMLTSPEDEKEKKIAPPFSHQRNSLPLDVHSKKVTLRPYINTSRIYCASILK